jgi:hypothetical protein
MKRINPIKRNSIIHKRVVREEIFSVYPTQLATSWNYTGLNISTPVDTKKHCVSEEKEWSFCLFLFVALFTNTHVLPHKVKFPDKTFYTVFSTEVLFLGRLTERNK